MAQDQKQNSIIEAAIKRFAHFGVAKTTMNEIAKDLAISKALLYYYFPDKISLYGAVLKHIVSINRESTDLEINRQKTPAKAIEVFLDLRTDFIIKYHHILEFLKQFTASSMPETLQEIFKEFKKQDYQRIVDIIEMGRSSGLFKIENSRKIAELYIDFLEGFRSSYFTGQPNFFPGKKEFLSILKKEKEFSAIFFNGLLGR